MKKQARLTQIPIGSKFKYLNATYIRTCATEQYQPNAKRISDNKPYRFNGNLLVEVIDNE